MSTLSPSLTHASAVPSPPFAFPPSPCYPFSAAPSATLAVPSAERACPTAPFARQTILGASRKSRSCWEPCCESSLKFIVPQTMVA